jgi:lipopolysaccharide biosynthesis glycosyltransferase
MDDFAICYVTGEGIYDETLVSVYSLLENNSQEEYDIFIFDTIIREEFSQKLESLSEGFPGIELLYQAVDEENLNLVPRDAGMFHWSTNIRLLLPKLVPDNIRWLLYIDYDTIVDANIRSIAQHVDDTFDILGVMEEVRLAQAEVGEIVKYVNAGVLLMNATSWRAEQLSESLLSYVSETKPRYADQNAVNSQISFNKIGLLPLQYNFSRRMWDQMSPETDQSGLQAKIYHFWGPWKPWHRFSGHELDSIWHRYRDACPVPLDIGQYKGSLMMDLFESIILQNMDFDAKLRRVINRILFS